MGDHSLLISKNDLHRIGLQFSDAKSFKQVFGDSDKKHVEQLVNFLLESGGKNPQIYLHGQAAGNIIKMDLPTGEIGSKSYLVPYNSISLAVANGDAKQLADVIYALTDSDSGLLLPEVKKILSTDLISFISTKEEPLSKSNVPIYSFRTTWKSNYPEDWSNNAPKDIVVGLYDMFRI